MNPALRSEKSSVMSDTKRRDLVRERHRRWEALVEHATTTCNVCRHDPGWLFVGFETECAEREALIDGYVQVRDKVRELDEAQRKP